MRTNLNFRSRMTSCEKWRSSAYSKDLRWRIIWQRHALGFTCQKVAENLSIDKSTVSRITQLFATTGDVSKKPYPNERAYRKLTLPAQFLIFQLVIDKPGIRLKEIQDELLNTLLIDVSQSTIFRFLSKSGYTYRRLKIVARQRDEFCRQLYISDMSLYYPDMLIFVDETGADEKDSIRKHGYSMRGKPLVSHKFLIRGERVSAIACISIAGLVDVMTVKGTTDGDTFYHFIQTHLLPHLMPFNGTNPHSVVVMDNCSIHSVEHIVSSIQDVGALVQFLPPYSPDLQPLKKPFQKSKQE